MQRGLFAQLVVVPLFTERRILSQVAGHELNVIKILPPLVVTEGDVDWFAARSSRSSARRSGCRARCGFALRAAPAGAKAGPLQLADLGVAVGDAAARPALAPRDEPLGELAHPEAVGRRVRAGDLDPHLVERASASSLISCRCSATIETFADVGQRARREPSISAGVASRPAKMPKLTRISSAGGSGTAHGECEHPRPRGSLPSIAAPNPRAAPSGNAIATTARPRPRRRGRRPRPGRSQICSSVQDESRTSRMKYVSGSTSAIAARNAGNECDEKKRPR